MQLPKALAISYENDRHALRSLIKKFSSFDVNLLEAGVSQVSSYSFDRRSNEYDITPALDIFYSTYHKISPEHVYSSLKKYEVLYFKRKNINQLLRTAPYLCEDHHFRKPFYVIPNSHLLRCYYLLCHFEYLLSLFDKLSPAFVICFNVNNLYKQLAADICSQKGIEYYSIFPSRIQSYLVLLDSKFIPRRFSPDQISTSSYEQAHNIVSSSQGSLSTSIYKGIFDVAAKQASAGRIKLIVNSFYNFFIYLIASAKFLISYNIRMKFKSKPYPLFNSSERLNLVNEIYILNNSLQFIMSRFYSGQSYKTIEQLQSHSISYIYIALHSLPESATLSQSNFYYEDDLIRNIASQLPVDVHIVVKENPLMIGQRAFSYYERLESLSNVHILPPDISSEYLIKNSIGVVSLAGTVILESLLVSTPVLVLGTPEINFLVHPKYRLLSSFKLFIKDILSSDYIFLDNLEQYISSIAELGILLEPGDLTKIYLGSSASDLAVIADKIYTGMKKLPQFAL